MSDTVIRRRILVDWKFQLQYLSIWLWVGVAMVAMSLLFYLLGGRLLGMRQFDPEITRFLGGLSGFLLVFCFLMGLLSVVLTHRVAGAAYRLEMCVRELAKGNLDGRIALRKSDYLQNLAAALDELREILRRAGSEREHLANSLEKAIAVLDQSGKVGPEERSLLVQTVQELRRK